MNDVASAQSENENLRKIHIRLLQWDTKNNPLVELDAQQDELIETLFNAWRDDNKTLDEISATEKDISEVDGDVKFSFISPSYKELTTKNSYCISNSNDFMLWYNRVYAEICDYRDTSFHRYLQQLQLLSAECCNMLEQINDATHQLDTLSGEYEFVFEKTNNLNSTSEQLIDEQKKCQDLSDEIQRRLRYFTQVELLQKRLLSPTLSVASEVFRDCLDRIDECLEYLQQNPKFKDSAMFVIKYKHCLSKAITLIKSYVIAVLTQATDATLHPKQSQLPVNEVAAITTPDTAFALYYGKYQTSAAKIKRVTLLIEGRVEQSVEYEQLLNELQQAYFNERASIMSPAVSSAIKDLKTTHKGDHCSMMRSACGFLVYVCQDEHRLYYQFFSKGNEQFRTYLEGLCTILYDTLRPYVIHINHLETLAEVCSILRIEMLEEHVQQNPEPLEAFANTVHQLLQDVQERLVFRAHLYLQSDILNYSPSAGDLAYPEKLEMMESIALSLQEAQHLRRSDSRSSLISTASSAFDTESVDTAYRQRSTNSPADLHGMWYPTVRRTLVCLSRLYRCIDRPIFQGLSQEAIKLCIESIASARNKISANKTVIDGELFEIKHLLILREQIAPFRVDFTVKETSLDFSKVKTAAFGLLQKRKQLFSMGSNNALLEFLLEGTPQIKEHLLDSRKEVDRQLKSICEEFIRNAVKLLVGPVLAFLDKALELTADTKTDNDKSKYILRQTSWASPQHISVTVQESQRLIKSKLAGLQRSMQLYLSNRDTEFIIFRPIRNNVMQAFVKLEQLLTTNGYSSDDLIITSCPSPEQVSILLSSASILAAEGLANFSHVPRKISTSSNESNNPSHATSSMTRKSILEKKNNSESSAATIENVPEISESDASSTTMPASPDRTSEIEKV
ncbi:conserved oligomeric Golgi complex subunit 3 [Teleopsis dalmanni]|uniref:conserved oligomeric Golgi complex subunit 3 n=1 Tax=Teleopsis dalmanni TaxID=139649 RepID=UPI0018CEA6F4|nr:conserved oligomeric Golgi complex subunit 3 [Teleopsis dalmanni]